MAQTLGADIKHAFCTLAVYTALAVKDEGTLYNVWDEGAIYRGSACIVRSGNTLNTSSTAQTKAGALTVSGLLTANGGLNTSTGVFSYDATYTDSAAGTLFIQNKTTQAKAIVMGFDSQAGVDAGFIQSLHSGVGLKNLLINPRGGNVGINTNSPIAKLDVVGQSGITTFTGTNRLAIAVRGGSEASEYSGLDIIGGTSIGSYPIARIAASRSASGSFLQFGTTNSWANGITNTAMTIDPSGKVGIGTAAPSDQLTVSGGNIKIIGASADGSGQLLLCSNNYIGSIAGKTNSGAVSWQIRSYGGPLRFGTDDASSLQFYTNGITNPRVTIDTAGNVGIGTISPAHLLTLSRNYNATIGLYNTKTDNADVRNWALFTDAYSYGDFGIAVSNNQGGNPVTQGSIKLLITEIGYVGIGTTTPVSKLDLKDGTFTLSGTGSFGSVLADRAVLYRDATNGLIIAGVGSTNDFAILNKGGSNVLQIPTGTTNVIFNGNVGIGTSTPQRLLSLYGGYNSVGQLRLGTSDSYYWDLGRENVGVGRFMFINNNNGVLTEPLSISPSGNVGIGTTTPSEKLQIVTGNAAGIAWKFSTAFGNSSISNVWDSSTDTSNRMSFNVNTAAGTSVRVMSLFGSGMVEVPSVLNVGTGTGLQTWEKLTASASSGAVGLSARSGNKVVYLYNDGTTVKLDAADYTSGGVALGFAIAQNGGQVTFGGSVAMNSTLTVASTLTVTGSLTCQQQGSFVGLLIKNATGQQQLISVDANSNLVFNGNAFATGSLGAKGVAAGGFDTPPASMTAAGKVNETRWCADGIYRCIASGNWKKVAYINF